MKKKLTSDKLISLEEQLSQLKAQHASEKARLRAKAKKDDTRKKFLIGAYIFEKAQKEGSMDKLIKEMDSFLKGKADRKLFGLDTETK